MCSYYHRLLNTFLDIVVLLTDTYTYCVHYMPTSVAALSKACVRGRSLAGIGRSNPAGLSLPSVMFLSVIVKPP